MSFPTLVLTGVVNDNSISSIDVTYPNDPATVTKPAFLTRSRYDVKRQYNTINVSAGTPKRYMDVPYNAMRYIHSWVGYIDVTSASVGVYASSTAAVILNMDLIKTATIYKPTNGIQYTLPVKDVFGPDDPSLVQTYEAGFEAGREWVYKIETDGGNPPVYTSTNTTFWNIKDINILDNQNGTSRVTFSFEIITSWRNTADIIDANTP